MNAPTPLARLDLAGRCAALDRLAELLLEDSLLRRRIEAALPETPAQQALTETLRFLFLVSQAGQPLTPPAKLDLIWHELILFTQRYAELCTGYFGKFIHHLPDDDTAKNRRQWRKGLALYMFWFGQLPPPLWGDGAFGNCGPCRAQEESDALDGCHRG